MRIAIFCPTVSGMGGMESAIRNLMAGFRALGDETRLFLFGGTFDEGWLEGIECTRYGSPHNARLQRMWNYAYGPAKSIAGWKPDAVICADVTALRMAKLGRLLAGRPRTLLASWVHFPVARVRMREKLGDADLHLAISGTIAQDLAAYLPQHCDRIYSVYNAVDVASIALLPRPEIPEFLYVGRLMWDDQKRVNDLLSAAARLRGDWHLKIVGAAPDSKPEYDAQLKGYAAELGLTDRISWLGWQRDPWAAASKASVLVMPSSREGFPMVLLEAHARGLVCLSSDCESGPSEIVLEGTNGWLFPVGDVERLARLMQQVVDDPSLLPAPGAVRETAYRYAAPAIAQRAKDAILATRARRPV